MASHQLKENKKTNLVILVCEIYQIKMFNLEWCRMKDTVYPKLPPSIHLLLLFYNNSQNTL